MGLISFLQRKNQEGGGHGIVFNPLVRRVQQGPVAQGFQNIFFNKPTPNYVLNPNRSLISATQRTAPIGPVRPPTPPQIVPPVPVTPSPQPVQPLTRLPAPTSPDFLPKVVLPITRQYKIPDPIAAGQWAAEGRGAGLGANRNNFFNLGAVDSNPNNAASFDTPQAGIEAYAKFLTSPQWANGVKNVVPNYFSNPLTALKQIEQQGYAGDKRTYKKRSNTGFDRYWKFIMSTPEWKQYGG
jgi:hypothetical protein